MYIVSDMIKKIEIFLHFRCKPRKLHCCMWVLAGGTEWNLIRGHHGVAAEKSYILLCFLRLAGLVIFVTNKRKCYSICFAKFFGTKQGLRFCLVSADFFSIYCIKCFEIYVWSIKYILFIKLKTQLRIICNTNLLSLISLYLNTNCQIKRKSCTY
jgi:hypothetical protein